MIVNLEDFIKVQSRGKLYELQVEIGEEIPDQMPKLYINPFNSLMERVIRGEISHDEAFKDYMNPPMVDDMGLNMTKEFVLFECYKAHGMYGFVSWKWLNPFIDWLGDRKCLEVMAGRGWLSKGLREKGVNVIATDDYSWSRTHNWKEPLTEVIEMDAIQSIEKYAANVDIVIMSWPYMDDTAYRVMKRLHEINPNARLIYIGEMGGCTADEDFWETFCYDDTDKAFWEDVAPHYQSWESIRDKIFLGHYKE